MNNSCDDEFLDRKYSRLEEILSEMGNVVVAFSGGVDSSFLLYVARAVLKDRVLAVTAQSEVCPRHEIDDAQRLALEFGVRRMVIESDELKSPDFVKNPVDRCYICKRRRFSAIREIAGKQGALWLADGSNTDDQSDYRPGMKAIHELMVRSPLLEAGLSKSDRRYTKID